MRREEKLHNHEPSSSPETRMIDFIRKCGGEARFDVFAQEHLLGSGGFYSHHIDLSKEHAPVPTPMDTDLGYRKAYAQKVLDVILQVAQRSGKADLNVCEIGPGGGELHREIIHQFEANKDRYKEIHSISYHAVDPNPQHLGSINAQGGIGIRGISQALPLLTNSIDVLIAEEVLDSLPYRIIEITTQGTAGEEAFVTLEGDELKIRFKSRVDVEDEYEQLFDVFARLALADNPQASHFRFSNDYFKFWEECKRVLTEDGIAVVSDYSTTSLIGMIKMGANDLGHEEAALCSPYTRDLTHLINFNLQSAIATQVQFKVSQVRLDSGDINTMVTELVGGREILIADACQSSYSDMELKQYYDRQPSTKRVMDLILQRDPEDGRKVVDFLRKYSFDGSALWIIFADLAGNDMDQFMQVIEAENPEDINWIRSQTSE